MDDNQDTNIRLVYTVEEVGHLLGLSRGCAYESIRRGDIPSVRFGRRVLVPRVALERLLGERKSLDLPQDSGASKK